MFCNISFAADPIEPRRSEYAIQSGDTLIKITHYHFSPEKLDNYIRAIEITNGKMLIATRNQIFSFDGEKAFDIIEAENVRLTGINHIASDKQGGIWVWQQLRDRYPAVQNIATFCREKNEFLPLKEWFSDQSELKNMQFRHFGKLPNSELLLNSVDGRIFKITERREIKELELELPSKFLGLRKNDNILLEQEGVTGKFLVEIGLNGEEIFSSEINLVISAFASCIETKGFISCSEQTGDSATLWNFRTTETNWDFPSGFSTHYEGSFLKNMETFFKTQDGLVSIYRPKGDSLKKDHHLSILCQTHLNNSIPSLIHLQKHGTWIGSSLGLTYMTTGPAKFRTVLNEPQSPGISFRKLQYIDDSTIWAASYSGLFELELNEQKKIIPQEVDSDKENCAGRFIHTFKMSPNKEGVTYFSMNEWRVLNKENLECKVSSLGDLGIIEVWDIVHLWDEYFYIATDVGLYLFSESDESISFVNIMTGEDQEFTRNINRVHFNQNTKDLILCTGNGLIFADLKSEDPHVPVLNNLIKARRNVNDCIFLDDGTLMVSTWDDGMYWLSFPDFKVLRHFHVGYAIASNSTHNFSRDSRGRIWFSSNHGLYILDTSLEVVRKFNALNGIKELEFNHLALAVPNQNSKPTVYGGINGLTYFFPESVETVKRSKEPETLFFSITGSPKTINDRISIREMGEKIFLRRGTKGFKLHFDTEYLDRQIKVSYRIKDSGDPWQKAFYGVINSFEWEKGSYNLELLLELPNKELIYLENNLEIKIGGWQPGITEILIGIFSLNLLIWIIVYKKIRTKRKIVKF